MGTQYLDGFVYLSFLLCPFRYYPQEQILTLLNHVELDITVTESPHVLTSFHNKRDVMKDVITRRVINKEDISDLYYPFTQSSLLSTLNNSSDSVEYLIITSDSLKSAFMKLARWKTIKGVRTKVLTLEEISPYVHSWSNIPYNINAIEVKQAIKPYKDNGTQYVLLAGDANIIPVAQCYIKYEPQTSGAITTPCDLFYDCYGAGNSWDLTWDANGNGIMGEVSDNVDYQPQLWVTRLSVSSLEEAEIQVERIIEYEMHPKMDGWTNNILMAGSQLYQTQPINGRPVSDSEMRGDLIYQDVYAKWDDCERFQFYDTWTSHIDRAAYEMNTNHLHDLLNTGFTLFNMDAHGNANRWKLEVDSFKISDALSYTNPRYSILLTTACHTNALDSIPFLGESFMKNPNGGVLAYWGSSRYGWLNANSYFALGPSDQFNMAFYNALFDNTSQYKHLGKIAAEAKSYCSVPNMPYTDPNRWLLFSINVLGDPEMHIYTERPKLMDDTEIFWDDGLHITYGINLEGRKVCIMSLDDMGESYFRVYEDYETMQLDYETPASDFSVCVTKPGYVPIVLYVFHNGYLQNEILTENSICISNHVMVGSDVTILKPEGPVVVEKGKTSLIGPQSVTINNNFKIEKGAELYIGPVEEQ